MAPKLCWVNSAFLFMIYLWIWIHITGFKDANNSLSLFIFSFLSHSCLHSFPHFIFVHSLSVFSAVLWTVCPLFVITVCPRSLPFCIVTFKIEPRLLGHTVGLMRLPLPRIILPGGGGWRGLGYSWRGRGRFRANISADLKAESKLIFYSLYIHIRRTHYTRRLFESNC